jgi:hypothetical protein
MPYIDILSMIVDLYYEDFGPTKYWLLAAEVELLQCLPKYMHMLSW